MRLAVRRALSCAVCYLRLLFWRPATVRRPPLGLPKEMIVSLLAPDNELVLITEHAAQIGLL